jgi:hypothetical protein
MTTKTSKNSPPSGDRLKISLFWKVLVIEGEGTLPVAGALLLGLLVFAWVALH